MYVCTLPTLFLLPAPPSRYGTLAAEVTLTPVWLSCTEEPRKRDPSARATLRHPVCRGARAGNLAVRPGNALRVMVPGTLVLGPFLLNCWVTKPHVGGSDHHTPPPPLFPAQQSTMTRGQVQCIGRGVPAPLAPPRTLQLHGREMSSSSGQSSCAI